MLITLQATHYKLSPLLQEACPDHSVLGENCWSTQPNIRETPAPKPRHPPPTHTPTRGLQAKLLTKHLLEFGHKGAFRRAGLPGQSSSSLKSPPIQHVIILSCIASYCVVNSVSPAHWKLVGKKQAQLTPVGPQGAEGSA